MATKPKVPATGTAVAVKKASSGAVVSIRDTLKAQAAANSSRIAAPGGPKIRLDGRKFAFPDGTSTVDPVQVVIVDFINANSYYDRSYVKGTVVPPACFALGDNPKAMVPSDASPDKQCDTCTGCPMNEYGTAATGKGKACKNEVLLAVLPVDAAADAPLWIMKVSPTGLKSFYGYIAALSRMTMAPVEMITTVSFDDSTYPTLVFGDPTNNADFEAHYGRMDEAKALLAQEPDVSGYEAEVQKPKPKPKVTGVRR